MGTDLIALFERLGLSTVNSIILAVLAWRIWSIGNKLDELEGPDGPLQKMEDRTDEHDVCLAVHAQQLKRLEFDAGRDEGRR